MAQLRVRVINVDENSRKQIPEFRKRLWKEAAVELQCESRGCYLLTIKSLKRIQVMRILLEEYGFEFYYTPEDYQPDWSNFQPTVGCDCTACSAAREYLAAQKNGKKTK